MNGEKRSSVLILRVQEQRKYDELHGQARAAHLFGICRDDVVPGGTNLVAADALRDRKGLALP